MSLSPLRDHRAIEESSADTWTTYPPVDKDMYLIGDIGTLALYIVQ
jgi:hypothetical protein